MENLEKMPKYGKNMAKMAIYGPVHKIWKIWKNFSRFLYRNRRKTCFYITFKPKQVVEKIWKSIEIRSLIIIIGRVTKISVILARQKFEIFAFAWTYLYFILQLL